METVKNYRRIDDLFVPPVEYDAICNALKANQIVFITGPAEYGKTYTAIRLLWEYFNNGYEPVYLPWVEENDNVAKKLITIEDALEPYHVYYYEDPFGKIKYKRNPELERSISSIIDIVRNSDDAYVIITSREEIFKEFQGRNIGIKKFEQKLNIKTPSYDYEKRKEMLLKRAVDMNSVWLDNEDVRNTVLKSMEDETMLPTPLNIRNFVNAVKRETDKQIILHIMKEKSVETAISFGKEIEDMLPHHSDRMVFLSFPFISDGFTEEFVKSNYEELIKQLKEDLKIENPWNFNGVFNYFKEDKIEIKDNNLRFSHPSYSEAIKYIISEDRFTTKEKK